jgi:hypothetical protein
MFYFFWTQHKGLLIPVPFGPGPGEKKSFQMSPAFAVLQKQTAKKPR